MMPALEKLAPSRATNPDEWSILMTRAQAGDEAAYHRLLLGITPYLRARASRAHRNPSDAEDTVQDILLTLHAVRKTYDSARPFKPWLAGIARHRVVDRMRRQGRIAEREVFMGFEHEAFAQPDPSFEMNLDVHNLRAGLRSLPESQRKAVTMLKVEEMSLKRASELSGMSVGSLKVSTHRGITALRRLLASKAGGTQ